MSERSYESLRTDARVPLKIKERDFEGLGLSIPLSQTITAMQALLWDTSSKATRQMVTVPAGGILLFGCPGVAEYIVDVIRRGYPAVKKFVLKWQSFQTNGRNKTSMEEKVNSFFGNIKQYGKCVVVLDEMDKMIGRSDILSPVFTQLENLLKEDRDIVVLGHLTEPWRLGETRLALFETKIFIPFPKEEKKIQTLKFFINELVENKFKGIIRNLCAHDLLQADFRRIVSLPSMEGATFMDLELVARKSIEISIRAKLGLRSEDDLREIKYNSSQLEQLQVTSSLVQAEHVQSAASQIKRVKYSKDDLVEFIATWHVIEYEEKPSKKSSDDEGNKYPKNKQPESFFEFFWLCLCSCTETCC